VLRYRPHFSLNSFPLICNSHLSHSHTITRTSLLSFYNSVNDVFGGGGWGSNSYTQTLFLTCTQVEKLLLVHMIANALSQWRKIQDIRLITEAFENFVNLTVEWMRSKQIYELFPLIKADYSDWLDIWNSSIFLLNYHFWICSKSLFHNLMLTL